MWDTEGHVHQVIAQFMRKERGGKTVNGNEEMNVRVIIEQACAEFCDKYCKWPYLWDEEKEGMELCESEHCHNCPTMRLY